jgi:hypothetical protein
MNMLQQPLTGKELQYVVDSMANEDLLIKQCAMAASQSQNAAVRQPLLDMMQAHHQHYHALLNVLNQHMQSAPQQPTQ